MRDRHLFWDIAPIVLLSVVVILLSVVVTDNYRSWGTLKQLSENQLKLAEQNQKLQTLLNAGSKAGNGGGAAAAQAKPAETTQAVKPSETVQAKPAGTDVNLAKRPAGYEDIPADVPLPQKPDIKHGDENADDGDSLTMTLFGEPNSLNPLIDNDATASDLFSRVHDSLAARLFEDYSVWEPRLARAWKKEMICRVYVKDNQARELAAEIEAKWDAALKSKLQITRIGAESGDVLRLEIGGVNNDYREQLVKDFGGRILKQYWFYVDFKGQKLPDQKTDLTAAFLAPKIVDAIKGSPGFKGRVLPAWNRQNSVVVMVLGDEQTRGQAQAALKVLLARPDNQAWVIDQGKAAGGHLETCMSCDLAEEYPAQEKPVFTFYLRKDVKWHDGAPFTGKDVVFSYRTMMDTRIDAGPSRNYYQDCEGVELVNGDPFVVRFTWFKPYFDSFASSAGFEPMAEHIYRYDDPKQFNEGPQNQTLTGNGDYKLDHWTRGVEIVFARNENYYGPKAHFGRIVYKVVRDHTVELQLFEKGDTDIYGLQPSQMANKENDPEFRKKFGINITVANNYRYVGWNARKPQFTDKRVRQALTMLIDRQRICSDIQHGYATPLNGPSHPDTPAYWKDIDKHAWPFDPQRAQKLLTEAGWKDTDGDGILDKDGVSFKFTLLIVAQNPEYEAMANLIKDALRKTGIQMEINNLEWAALLQRLERLQFDACIMGWRLGLADDPYQLWHSSQTREKESNFCNFVNKEADRLIEQSRTELNEKKRNAIMQRIQEIILDEQPYTFLFVSKRLVAYDKRIQNVKFRLLGSNQQYWWVPKGLQKQKE